MKTTDSGQRAYGRILKSSSLVGGAEGINMLIGMVRIKFMAVLLGPTGVGLLGLFQSIQTMSKTISTCGINNSGVREIAQANGTSDPQAIARVAITLRRLCWILGGLGALLLFTLAPYVGELTFGDSTHTQSIRLLSIAVLLMSISGGQMALLQGMRRIADMACANVLSAFFGSILAVYCYWQLGVDGIVPGMVALAAVTCLFSLYFSRQVRLEPIRLSWRASFVCGAGLLSLGLAFMWNGLVSGGVEYATRWLIIEEIDLAAVGIFMAAYRLSGMFLNFILGAMAADFYPSLAALSGDHAKMRILVNQQIEVGLLIALPGLMATLLFSPWIIQVFYTAEFAQAVPMLQWFVIGCLGRVINWPMGLVVVAKGKAKVFALLQTFFQGIYLGFIFIGLKLWGLAGVAYGFAGFYLIHIFAVYFVAKWIIGFSWERTVWHLISKSLLLALLSLIVSRSLPLGWATAIGGMVTLVISILCLRSLAGLLERSHRINRFICKIPYVGELIVGR